MLRWLVADDTPLGRASAQRRVTRGAACFEDLTDSASYLIAHASVIVSVSTPIIKSVTFLTADLSVSVASVTIDGTVNLGTFGWCLNGVGTKPVCQGPQLGYELDSDQVFGNNTSFSLPNSLIKWLTYALVVHPIAAGLAAASFLSGCISHCREFSTSRITTWLTSLATTVALIAFVFDIVLFSIARSRINSASNTEVGLDARLGNAVWLTLVGFILLFLSGCLFGFGHRCIKRRPTQEEKDRVRPQMDTVYASAARKEAEDLEKAGKIRRGESSGLPAFPEEAVPLTSVPKTEELYSEEYSNSQDIAGVGTGYGRGHNQNALYSSPSRERTRLPPAAQTQPSQTAYPSRNNSDNYGRAEPFVSMYDAPSRQDSPAYGRPSRGRQRSDASSATPYISPSRRQTSGSVDAYGHNIYPHNDTLPPVPQPPLLDGYGYDSGINIASGGAETASQGYGPHGMQYEAGYSSHRGAQYSSNQYQHAYEQYPPTATYTQTMLPPSTGQEGFHAVAATSRHKQSQSMGAAATGYAGHQGRHRQSLSDSNWPHQSDRTGQPNAYLPPPRDGRRYDAATRTADLPTGQYQAAALEVPAGESPTTDIYNSYYTPSPQNVNPPAAIPYVADPEATPSPSYHSAEPYPTYGGNVYR